MEFLIYLPLYRLSFAPNATAYFCCQSDLFYMSTKLATVFLCRVFRQILKLGGKKKVHVSCELLLSEMIDLRGEKNKTFLISFFSLALAHIFSPSTKLRLGAFACLSICLFACLFDSTIISLSFMHNGLKFSKSRK